MGSREEFRRWLGGRWNWPDLAGGKPKWAKIGTGSCIRGDDGGELTILTFVVVDKVSVTILEEQLVL